MRPQCICNNLIIMPGYKWTHLDRSITLETSLIALVLFDIIVFFTCNFAILSGVVKRYLLDLITYLTTYLLPVTCQLSHLSIGANSSCQHSDDADTLLPDHLPEVADGVWQRSLCRYVTQLVTAYFHLSPTVKPLTSTVVIWLQQLSSTRARSG